MNPVEQKKNMFDNFAQKRKRICLIAYKMVNWQDDHAIGHVLTNHTFTLGMFLPISPFIYICCNLNSVILKFTKPQFTPEKGTYWNSGDKDKSMQCRLITPLVSGLRKSREE